MKWAVIDGKLDNVVLQYFLKELKTHEYFMDKIMGKYQTVFFFSPRFN